MRETTTRLHCVLGVLVLELLSGCNQTAVRRQSLEDRGLPRLTSAELFEIAVFQAHRGDFLRAEQYLSAAREEGHAEAPVVYWLVRVCVSAGRFHSALVHASDHLRDNPSNWSLRLVVASIYEALGDLVAAQLQLENIVDSEPRRALPRYRLAMLYRRLNPFGDRALSHLRAYLEIAPDGPHAAEVQMELDRASSTPSASLRLEIPDVLEGKAP